MSTPRQFVAEPAARPATASAPAGSRSAKRGFWSPFNPRITDWQGLRVWLIGASSGIGAATASALHARGAQVLVSARSADSLQAFVQRHTGGARSRRTADYVLRTDTVALLANRIASIFKCRCHAAASFPTMVSFLS